MRPPQRHHTIVILATAVLATLALIAGGLHFWPFGTEQSAAPAAVPPEPESDPVYVAEGTTNTLDQVRQIAYDVCPQALDAGSCLDYTVTVAPLDEAMGEVEVAWERSTSDQGASALTAAGITVDEDLVGESPQYVAYVAAHEWNHVEQVNVASTVAGREAMRSEAFGYYDARLPAGLPDERLGMEVLADCMTVLGDGVVAGEGRGGHYLQMYAGGEAAADACGQWWVPLSK